MFPVVMSQPSQMPVLPSEMTDIFKALFASTFAGMGSGMRRIRVGRLAFELVEGQSKTEVPPDQMVCVFLGSAPYSHCVWYERAYATGQEPEAPDLLWHFPTGQEFPDALPQQFRQKIVRDGRERWAFSIRRRTVWAMMRPDVETGQLYIELDKPYVFDLGSMSIFGRGGESIGAMRWSGVRALCDRYSGPSFQCLPFMFPIQILMHPTEPQGVVLFKPGMVGDMPAFFDTATIMKIYERTQAADIKDLLDVKEKLEWDGAVTPEAPRPAAAPVPPPMPEPAPVVPPVPGPAPVVPPTPGPDPVVPPTPGPDPIVPPVPGPAPVVPPTPEPAPTVPPMPGDLLSQAAALLNGGAASDVQEDPAATVQSTVDALKSLLG